MYAKTSSGEEHGPYIWLLMVRLLFVRVSSQDMIHSDVRLTQQLHLSLSEVKSADRKFQTLSQLTLSTMAIQCSLQRPNSVADQSVRASHLEHNVIFDVSFCSLFE